MTSTITKLFQPQAVGSGQTTIYTAPSPTVSPTAVIRNGIARFCNTTNGNLTISAWMVPYQQTAGASNQFLATEPVATAAHLDVDLPVMAAGDYFVAEGSNTGITVHCLDGTLYTSP